MIKFFSFFNNIIKPIIIFIIAPFFTFFTFILSTLLIILLFFLLVIGGSSTTHDVLKYEKIFNEQYTYNIFPETIKNISNIQEFTFSKHSIIDDTYVGYLVVRYDDNEYLYEKNRLLSIDSTVNYEYFYGIKSFKKELCANYIKADNVVYALSDDKLKSISYVYMFFCDEFCDIDYNKIINEEDLPIGFNALIKNQTQIDRDNGLFIRNNYDFKSNLLYYKLNLKNKELIISNNNKDEYILSSFSKIKDIYDEYGNSIEIITFEKGDSIFKPKTLEFLFNNPNLKKINGFENIDTSNTSDFSYLFSECNCFDENIVSSLIKKSTASSVAFCGMFSNCRNIQYINLSNYNLSNDVNLDYCFDNCVNLKKIDFSNSNLSNCYRLKSTFRNCKSLTEINFNNALFLKIGNMDGIFESCESIESIDLSCFDLSNLDDRSVLYEHPEWYDSNDYKGYFVNCTNLKYVFFPKSFNLKCLDYERDFAGCDNLEAIYYKDGENIKLIKKFK